MNTNQKSMRYDQNDYDALLHSKIPAALVETPQMNFDDDSDASVFFARELDYVKSQSYDVEYPEFTALKLFPVSSEINPGAETVTYYSYDKTGMAKIISNYATDLPRADVKGKPTTAIIKSLGDSYGYSIQEMRASAMAGKSLDARKAESARYQIDYLNNKIAWNGDAETGLRGVLSKDNDVPLYVPATGAKGSTKWADKTEDEILADITGMLKQVARTTKKVEEKPAAPTAKAAEPVKAEKPVVKKAKAEPAAPAAEVKAAPVVETKAETTAPTTKAASAAEAKTAPAAAKPKAKRAPCKKTVKK